MFELRAAATAPEAPPRDERQDSLAQWASEALGTHRFTLAPASEDASFRRYFRLTLQADAALARGKRTLICMDAPPPMEDCRPYVRVARMLIDAGVHAPEVFAADLERGYLLLTDLGDTTYLAALDAERAAELYSDAIDALILWQQASRDGELAPYDETLLQRELDLFPDWYVAKHLALTLSDAQRETLAGMFRVVRENNLSQAQVYVHRDYHSRNLMVRTPNPGVLDFQDAVHGPITYDLVSLLRDAYVSWDEELQIDWAIRYWERARQASLPVPSDFSVFWRDFEWMGVQRQLKVLGIFARLYHRDGKAGYLRDMPRVMAYLRGAVERYNGLAPLARLLDELEHRQPVTGYSC
jgi:aminoglycoside/choline kinase family phosphotransferase